MYNVPHKVLLPAWIFEQAKDRNELRSLVLEYMKRYPDYQMIKISGSFAICEREQAFLGGSYSYD